MQRALPLHQPCLPVLSLWDSQHGAQPHPGRPLRAGRDPSVPGLQPTYQTPESAQAQLSTLGGLSDTWDLQCTLTKKCLWDPCRDHCMTSGHPEVKMQKITNPEVACSPEQIAAGPSYSSASTSRTSLCGDVAGTAIPARVPRRPISESAHSANLIS